MIAVPIGCDPIGTPLAAESPCTLIRGDSLNLTLHSFLSESNVMKKNNWWHGAVPPNMRRITTVVPRCSERTVAIVHALVPSDYGWDHHPDHGPVSWLFGDMTLAVGAWGRATDDGRSTLESTNFDFNIGDLCDALGDSHLDPIAGPKKGTLPHFLRNEDILALRIECFSSDEDEHGWNFDDRVFDEFEFNSGHRRPAKTWN